MGSDDQTHLGSSRRQGNGWAIVERSGHATFRMGAYLIWSTQKSRLDDFQIQQVVGTTSRDYPKTSREHINEGSRVAIQAVQTQEHRG